MDKKRAQETEAKGTRLNIEERGDRKKRGGGDRIGSLFNKGKREARRTKQAGKGYE